MLFIELGQKLAQKREEQGKTIEDVSIAIKLSLRIITALEEGDKESLLFCGVYMRNYVKCYCTFLGYTQEETSQMINDTPEILCEDDEEKSTKGMESTKKKDIIKRKEFIKRKKEDDTIEHSKKLNSFPHKFVLIGLLILCVCAVGGFFFFFKDSKDPQSMILTTPQDVLDVSEVPSVSDVILEVSEIPPEESEALNEASPTLIEDDPFILADDTEEEVVEVEQPVVEAQNPEIEEQEPQQDQEELVLSLSPTQTRSPLLNADTALIAEKVILDASEDCWIQIIVDQSAPRQMLLREGRQHEILFKNTLRIRLGNAGGVHVTYNDEKLPSLGRTSEVRTLNFPL